MASNETYAELVEAIVASGSMLESRIGPTHEILGAQMWIRPGVIHVRKGFSLPFAMVDAFQALAGYFNKEELEDALGFKMRIPYRTASAWGPYVYEQFPDVLYQLMVHPETRRAVIHFGADRSGEQEKPCCTSIQYLKRGGELVCVVQMRSWDIGVGFLYDIVVFQVLAMVLAEYLGIKPGPIAITAGSAHVYQKDIDEGRFGETAATTREAADGTHLELAFPELREMEAIEFDLSPIFKRFIRTESDVLSTNPRSPKESYQQLTSLVREITQVYSEITPEADQVPTLVTILEDNND